MDHINTNNTEKYFNTIASQYGRNQGSNTDKYSDIKELLYPSCTHTDIIECGGGGGFYTEKFLNDGYKVTVVDISNDALTFNYEHTENSLKPNLTTIHGNFIEYISSTNLMFSQILFIKVLHHFDSLADIYTALSKSYEKCKPGGKIVIFEPNGKNILWKLFLSLRKDKTTKKRVWFFEQNMKFTTVQNFKTFCNNKQLPCKVRYHYIIPGFLLQKKVFLLSPILKLLNKIFLMTPIKYFSFNISCTITK